MANQNFDANGANSVAVMPSLARTATPDTMEYDNAGRTRGLTLVADMTAVTATGTVTFKVQGVDRTSGKTWDILASTAVSTVSTTVLRIGYGITAAANAAVSDVIPPVVRIVATHGNGVSMTYSVALHLSY